MKRFLPGFILSFLISLSSYATHIIGGDLTYKYLDIKRYEFTLTIYSECGSVAVLEDYYPIYYFSESQKVTQANPKNFIVTKVYSDEVIVFCPNVITNCSIGTSRGIRKVVYKGTVDLSAYNNAIDWNFYWKKAARSEEITTLVAPEEEDFFIHVTMNNEAVSNNNSPTFENNPVITACKGVAKTFNHIAKDQDGDDLVYSFVSPKNDLGLNVTYKDGFDHNKFVSLQSAVSINSTTGDITFTPTQVNQVGITDVLVREYRNGVLIGTVVRGMQITTLDCTNKVPTLSSLLPDNKDSIAVCAGQPVKLKITARDDDGQNVTITLLKGLGNSFSVLNNSTINPEASIVWETTPMDVGKYLFTVEAKDDGCPQPQTTTKTYIIQVLSVPEFDLGPDLNVKCDSIVELKPAILGGDGKYTYLWSTGETKPSIKAPVGTYTLSVTDGKGCSTTDNIGIYSGIFAVADINKLCLGQTTEFTDQSYSVNGTINKWEWKFGDGSTSNLQHPTHKYDKAGIYNVDLKVTTDNNCSGNLRKVITVCASPTVNFTNLDSCTAGPHYLNYVRFRDLTPAVSNCDISKRIWNWGDGTTSTYEPPFSPEDYHYYETEGLKNVSLTIITAAGCTSTVTKAIRIYRSPEINVLQDDYIFRCHPDYRDSTLVSEVLFEGNGDLKYQWNTGETTTKIDINNSGYYYLTVTDKFGGKDADYVNVEYPIAANFVFSPHCEPGDAINFTDKSVIKTNNTVSYEWNFGDNSGPSTEKNPSHTYSKLGIYNATLKIKDLVDGCESAQSLTVYNTYFIDTFAVFPKHISVCVNNIVTGLGPEPDLTNGSLINSYEWDFGNGEIHYGREATTFYPLVGEYVVKLKVKYNEQAGINDGCEKVYTDTITVYPEFRVDFDPFRVCTNDPVELSFRRTAGDLKIGIRSAKWEIKNPKTGAVDVFTELKPTYTFKERQLYEVTLTARDSVGCESSITKNFFADVVAPPNFESNIVCAGEISTFTADFKDTYENLTNLFWDFGANDTLRTFYVRPNMAERKFEKGGKYPVTLIAYNSFTGCNLSVTKDIIVHDRPVVEFTADTVCALQPVSFTNLTTIGFGKVKAYSWDFGGGNTSNLQNPQFVFKTGGHHIVKLSAVSEEGCVSEVAKEVYVKEIPKAAFSIEEELLEAFKPLHFINSSEGEIESYYWDFGDGTYSTEKDPIHQYDTIKVYEVKLIVFNNLGCSDTITQKTNLNVRLDLPTAFTPNGDNTNDGLSLIHHGIKELYEFKIYNRWGEIIFDGGNNVNAIWDGTFKGKLQEVGNYVAYVKALGVYDTHFSFKKNVTLLK